MGKNEIDIAVIFERVKNIEETLERGIHDIMIKLDTKADKKDLESKVSMDRFRPVEKNVSIAIGLIISTVLVAAIGFLLKAGLGI